MAFSWSPKAQTLLRLVSNIYDRGLPRNQPPACASSWRANCLTYRDREYFPGEFWYYEVVDYNIRQEITHIKFADIVGIEVVARTLFPTQSVIFDSRLAAVCTRYRGTERRSRTSPLEKDPGMWSVPLLTLVCLRSLLLIEWNCSYIYI